MGGGQQKDVISLWRRDRDLRLSASFGVVFRYYNGYDTQESTAKGLYTCVMNSRGGVDRVVVGLKCCLMTVVGGGRCVQLQVCLCFAFFWAAMVSVPEVVCSSYSSSTRNSIG